MPVSNKRNFFNKKGFTLIELLITVAIISILVTIASASYATIQRSGRDAERKTDLKKLQSSLETFFNDKDAYPTEDWHTSSAYDQFGCSVDGVQHFNPIDVGQDFVCGGTIYISKLPGDPLTGLPYYYEVNEDILNNSVAQADPTKDPRWCGNPDTSGGPHPNCQQYTIWAVLENQNDPTVMVKWSGGTPTWVGNDPICKAGWDGDEWLRGLHPAEMPTHYNYCAHGPTL